MRALRRHAVPDRLTRVRRFAMRNPLRVMWSRWYLLYPRICAGMVGYAVIALFAVGFGAVLCLKGTDAHALTAGLLLAAPIVIAIVGVRITGISAFGVEVTLSDLVAPVAGDYTPVGGSFSESFGQGPRTPKDDIEMTASGVDGQNNDLLGPFTELIEHRSKLLMLDLRNDRYWWASRLYLVAALADDFTDVEAIVFTHAEDARLFVGIASPQVVRKHLARAAKPQKYTTAYRRARRAAAQCGDHPDLLAGILAHWPEKAVNYGIEGRSPSPLVGGRELRRWLGANLDTGSVSAGPLTPLKQYQVISHRRRYVAITEEGRLAQVINRDDMALAARLDRKVGTATQ